MATLSRVSNPTQSSLIYNARVATGIGQPMHPRELYAILQAYYKNNGLYDELMMLAYQANVWQEGMKPLRNPAYRVVEFYASKLWPGVLPDALPIVTENPAIQAPIEAVWRWSNFSNRKTVGARWVAMWGNAFLKVASSGDDTRVHYQLIEPGYVGNNFDVDERGHITYLRLDMPKTRRSGDMTEAYTHTEVWDEETMRIWEHTEGPDARLDQLGNPTTAVEMAEFGIDFVPFVHFKLRDIGEDLGVGAFTLQLDKIDEANRQVTRLHQMLYRYNKNHWVLAANGMDQTGRPLPPPNVGDSSTATNTGDRVTIGGDEMWRLPGNATMQSTVPQINYRDALNILQDQMMELERDMPELAYYRLREMNEVSGIAVRTLLSDAIDRVIDARANVEEALIRADKMALSIGQAMGIFDETLGNYDAGDFDHHFREREIIPLTPKEKAELVKLDVESGVPLTTSLKWRGRTDAEIEDMLADKATEASNTSQNLAQALLTAQRRQDQGAN